MLTLRELYLSYKRCYNRLATLYSSVLFPTVDLMYFTMGDVREFAWPADSRGQSRILQERVQIFVEFSQTWHNLVTKIVTTISKRALQYFSQIHKWSHFRLLKAAVKVVHRASCRSSLFWGGDRVHLGGAFCWRSLSTYKSDNILRGSSQFAGE